MFKNITDFIHEHYNEAGFIPLHAPVFNGREKEYLNDCIDSTFVSSVGEYVNRFEKMIAEYTGAKYAVAVVNGTAGLLVALSANGVRNNDYVITQSLTFVATANAISHLGAEPIFVDSQSETLSMCPDSLRQFLKDETYLDNGLCKLKKDDRIIKCCVPMHTFGHACKMDEILSVCSEYGLIVIEDAAESLGSKYKEKHTGTLGKCGVFSFNGNKVVTAGGGGVIITDDQRLAEKLKHITTTAKQSHAWEFIHDEIAFNFRLPNLNAALICAQLEYLEDILENKRETKECYAKFFKSIEGVSFFEPPEYSQGNNWLHTIKFKNISERDNFLKFSNENGIMARPFWRPMHLLDIFKDCPKTSQENTLNFYERFVNIPSGVRNDRTN